jgi:catechol 2,3-dioxygenase-like lactoylglutathione lyase family enzyme
MSTASAEPAANRTPVEATTIVKFHLSLNVRDLARSLPFYSALLGAAPVKVYKDYAKFEIDEPPLILSLKPKWAGVAGPLNHFGLRVRTLEELTAVQKRLEEAGYKPVRQDDVRCCYAHQTKFWVADPDGSLCEVYVLHEDFSEWGEGNKIGLALPSLRALGFWGSIRRGLSKLFCRRGSCSTEQPQ